MPPDTSDYHEPVMLAEVLQALDPKPGETMLDATLGGGGHSMALAERLEPGGVLIGLDRDPEALASAGERLNRTPRHISIIHIRSPFGKMDFALRQQPETEKIGLDGVLFDLGVSSHQLDTARGFSFRRDEPLDMQMDPDAGHTAANLLNESSEVEIARILWEYGDERFSRRIAHALVERRKKEPISTTLQLAETVERSIPRAAWPKDIHVATRTFQALRIAVNDELGQLQAGLTDAISRLKPGGRLVVLSYHSLEDRIVKQRFLEAAGRAPSAPGSSPAAFLNQGLSPTLEIVTRKPILPTGEEIARNPRARSARLRVARRVE